jgi:glucose-6-phosphate 1-dehydrogenase
VNPLPESDTTNPLRAGLREERAPEPCVVVIFGASGDLTRRKLVPALYNLLLERRLPGGFAVVGVARREMSDRAFADSLREGIERHSRRPLDEEIWNEIVPRIAYVRSTFEDPDGYARLSDRLGQVDRDHGTGGNRLYYLAVPPSAFPTVIERLDEAGLNRPAKRGRWARVVVEKPVGRDLRSATELNDTINRVFEEKDVYRIDHYLGKETVQNLLVFRFANAIFDPIWNRKYVDHVQLTVAESIGVEGRGGYYEESGTTRDMMQNHMFQLLCLTGMEPPVSLEPDAIRDEKVKVLRALRPVPPEAVGDETVRAQYGPGVVGGKKVPGYKEEPGVSPDSVTETYVMLRAYIDNWRWSGVPFYLRAGKRMTKRVTEVALQFRDVPHRLFPGGRPAPNTLAMRIQPDEGITLRFESKVPGPSPRLQPVSMDMRYGTSFGLQPPEAYERLLLDAILGDSTLFIRRDEVDAAWRFVDRLFEGWADATGEEPLPSYPAGTWGPKESDALLASDGRAWRRL